MPPAPATIVRTSRSWPGTSTTPIDPMPGSASSAKPSSIEIPRRRSSASRSVSAPVSAATSRVLPWSMWPAVPSVRPGPATVRSVKGAPHRLGGGPGLVVAEGPGVEEDEAVGDPGDDRRLAAAQRRGEPVRPPPARARRRRPGPATASSAGCRRPSWRSPSRPGRAHRSARPSARRGREARPRRRPASPSPGSNRDRGRGAAAGSPRGRRSGACRAARPGPAGWRRQRSIAAAGPAMMPACGPPSSLSAEKQVTAPAATESPISGSSPIGAEAPEPRSSISCRAWARAIAASSAIAGPSVNPTVRKFDWWTRISAFVRGPTAAS